MAATLGGITIFAATDGGFADTCGPAATGTLTAAVGARLLSTQSLHLRAPTLFCFCDCEQFVAVSCVLHMQHKIGAHVTPRTAEEDWDAPGKFFLTQSAHFRSSGRRASCDLEKRLPSSSHSAQIADLGMASALSAKVSW